MQVERKMRIKHSQTEKKNKKKQDEIFSVCRVNVCLGEDGRAGWRLCSEYVL